MPDIPRKVDRSVVEAAFAGREIPSRFFCAECGQRVSGTEYHPYLYCLLFKAGIGEQEKYLRMYGFEKVR
jgi:hypothetical protein